MSLNYTAKSIQTDNLRAYELKLEVFKSVGPEKLLPQPWLVVFQDH